MLQVQIVGIQLPTSVSISLVGHRSLEKDLSKNTSPLKFELVSADIAQHFASLRGPSGQEYSKCADFAINKKFGDPATSVFANFTTVSGNAFWTIEYVVSSLRLFASGDIRQGCLISDDDETQSDVVHGMKISMFPKKRDEVLSKPSTALIPQFFQQMHAWSSAATTKKPLEIAIRYFLRSYENHLLRSDDSIHAGSLRKTPVEDVILSLTIALEALFAFGEANEISYKIRVRAARLLGRTSEEAEQIMNLLNWAYSVRSAVAHGSFKSFESLSTKNKVKWLSANGNFSDWKYAAMCLRQLCRRAIVANLKLYSDGYSTERLRKAIDSPMPNSNDLIEARRIARISLAVSKWPKNPRAS